MLWNLPLGVAAHELRDAIATAARGGRDKRPNGEDGRAPKGTLPGGASSCAVRRCAPREGRVREPCVQWLPNEPLVLREGVRCAAPRAPVLTNAPRMPRTAAVPVPVTWSPAWPSAVGGR